MNAFQHYAAQLERSPMRLSSKSGQETPAEIRERIALRFLSKGPAKMTAIAEELGANEKLTAKVLCSLIDKKLVVKICPEHGAVKTWRLA